MKECSRSVVTALCLFASLIIPAGAAEITFTPEQSGQYSLSWPSDTPAWRLQYNTDLTTTNWIELTNFTVTNGTYTVFENPPDAARFYRLCQHPASEEQPPVPIVTDDDGDTLSLDKGHPTFIDATTPHYFDASQSIDPRGGTLDYHWVVGTPIASQTADRGITGYHSSILNIDDDSIGNFIPTACSLSLTLTHEPFDPYATTSQSNSVTFWIDYQGSQVTIAMFSACYNCSNTNTVDGCGCTFPQCYPSFETP